MLEDVAHKSYRIELLPNATKTKVITNRTKKDIVKDGEKIEYVKEFMSLGQLISFENQTEKESKVVLLAWQKYWNLKEITKIEK